MKYKINQKILWSNKKCIIIGTKEEPFRPSVDVYNRTERRPNKDYLLSLLDKIENNICVFSGEADVYEDEIDLTEW